jgi:hypothetical protein
MSLEDVPPPASRRKVWQKLAISLVPAAGLIWLMQSGSLPIVPRHEQFAHVAAWAVPVYVGIYCVLHSVRLSRWYFLLSAVDEEVSYWSVIRVGAVGLFAVALLPFRMGEVVRPLLIRRAPKLGFWTASGTIGAERIIDALAVSGLLLTGLRFAKPLNKLPDHIGTLPIHVDIVPRMALVCAVVFASGCIVMGIFYFWRDWARRVTETVVGVVSVPLARWLATKIGQMADGLGFLARPRHAIPYLIATTIYWLLTSAMFWSLAVGCGLEKVSYFGAMTTVGVVGLGILAPATPGFFGAWQLATYAALAMYLPPETVTEAGSVYAFLGYVLPIGMTVLAGVAGILAKPRALLLLSSEPEAREPSPDASAKLTASITPP